MRALLLLLLLIAPRLGGAAPGAPLGADVGGAEALWSDERGLLIIKKRAAIYEVQGGVSALRELPGFGGYGGGSRAVGTGAGAAAVVVVWDARGRAARRRGGAWETARLPFAGEGLCSGAIDAAGVFSCARADGTLVRWEGDKLLRYGPPLPGLKIGGVSAAPDGALYLTGGRRVFSFSGGRYREHVYPVLASRDEDLRGVHVSARRGLLYVATAGRIWALPLGRGAPRDYPIPDRAHVDKDQPELDVLRGSQAAELLWFRGREALYVFDGRDYYSIPTGARWAGSLFFSAGEAALYAGVPERVQASPVPVPGSGEATPLRDPPRRVFPLPFLRLGLGARWPQVDAAAFDLDLMVGFNLIWQKEALPTAAGLWLSPQLGYGYHGGGHLFVGGLGVGYGNLLAAVSYAPRLVLGPPGQGVVGLRHGVTGHFLYDLLGVEVSHQVLYGGALAGQDLRLMVLVNPVPLVGALAAMALYSLSGKLFKAVGRGIARRFWRR